MEVKKKKKKKRKRKTHIKINGQVFQLNKTWRHLSQKQQAAITGYCREEYSMFIKEHNRYPKKEERDMLIDKVYDRVCDRGINIPYHVIKTRFCSQIQKVKKSTPITISTD